MKNILNILSKYKLFIIALIISFIVFNVKLPYYIMAPGGVINITDRINVENANVNNGTINLLYVSEYDGTIASYLRAKLSKEWDVRPIKDVQVANETSKEIYERNRVMLENSVDIATIVAYKNANKKVNITSYDNTVIAIINDNPLEIGDKILEINNTKVNSLKEIKKIITSSEIGDKLLFKIIRDNKERTIEVEVKEEDGEKVIGVIIITNYEYDLSPKIDIKFKSSESGSSGGLMMTLAIYNAINEEDIIKGRNISGTGTISIDGTVGEIDGIKYKIMGAVKNKMDLILVPMANYEEAIKVKEKYSYDIEIIGVNTFEEALNYLRR